MNKLLWFISLIFASGGINGKPLKKQQLAGEEIVNENKLVELESKFMEEMKSLKEDFQKQLETALIMPNRLEVDLCKNGTGILADSVKQDGIDDQIKHHQTIGNQLNSSKLSDVVKPKLHYQSPGNNLAFTAINSTEREQPFIVSAGSTVHFQSVSMSEGGGYDNETSVYTCPVHGLYYVFASVMAGTIRNCNEDNRCWYTQELYAAITMNGAVQVAMQLWNYYDIPYGYDERIDGTSVSASAVVNCAAGSTIQVIATDDSLLKCSSKEYSTAPANMCHFTGFLISQLP